jgi:hypothetical protein
MRKIILLLSLFLVAVISAESQTIVTIEELQLKVNKLLLKKDLKAFADELAQSKEAGVDSLLLRLEVFGRAEQKERIRQTIIQLSEAPDLPPIPQRDWILQIIRRKISRDLPAQRIYYERLVEDDGYYSTNPFIQLWESEGDEKELDIWLAKKSIVGTSWFQIKLEHRLKVSTAQPIFDELAARVRQSPNDKTALNNYLYAVRHAQEYSLDKQKRLFDHETNWLGDIFQARNASEAYDFGVMFDSVNPALAIKYYEQSLNTSMTAQEIRAFEEKHRISSSIGRTPLVDWNKQMRYWTKEKLAAAYQRTEQAHLAQPLIEQLIISKNDDILSGKNFQLAGMVQSGSGARTVEAKILQDAGTRSNSAEYWMERLSYYQGRGESELMVKAFGEALAQSPAEAKERFINWFENSCGYSLRSDKQFEQLKSQLGEILLNEFNRTPVDSELAFEIVRTASEDGFNLKNFDELIFIRRRDVLPAIFEKRLKWGTKERDILRSVFRNERLSPNQKTFYLAKHEEMALRGPLGRILGLDELFKEIEEDSRRIPLILDYLRRAPRNAENEAFRRQATRSLFEAYIQTGKWQMAEKLLLEQQAVFLQNWGHWLERLAICAARQNASPDALRIWLKAVNFSGHSVFGLTNLADTPAKPQIREYYQQMKQRAPNSPIPDAALKILR